ncbi:MAG: FAD-binding oxidoreductase [Alphaproteobacteria bacterium]|nr:FAD-binding oxidoreductase [Alphaproteobacteria bacterium]
MNSKTSDPTVPLAPHERLRGWGGMSAPGREIRSEDLRAVTEGAVLSRGLGRSYGDASLPPPGVTEVVGTSLADRMLAFDPATGVLRAEAGLSLAALARAFLPQGWFTPVSTGTWFVTLGGMVASDVHGKNHHVAGTIGRHLRSLVVRLPSGEIVTCSRDQHPELFFACQGGMGLFGHILEVELALEKIPSPWVWQESYQCPDLDSLLDTLEASASWPMTACWIDTLATGGSFGRGLAMRGRWAERREAPPRMPAPGLSPTVPFDAPSWTLNDLSMKAFNFVWYHKQLREAAIGPVTPHAWFTPLDAVKHWSRAYGKRGFTQHQAVIPREAGRDKVRGFLEILSRRGGTGFLCVVKDCGPQGEGLLSFPRPGTSVALDLPVNDGIQDLIDELNRYVIDVGGRIYLTKDGYTRREHFEAMEAERLPAFHAARDRWDPERRLRSAMSVRLFGDPVGPATTTGAGR